MDSFTRLPRPDALSYQGVEAELSDVAAGDDLDLPLHGAVLGWWDAARGSRAMPEPRDFDIAAVSVAAGWLHLLEVIDGGADFRYRVFGTLVAAATGADFNGRLVSEQPDPVRVPLLALYRDVVVRPRALRSRLRFTGPDVVAPCWERLILPLGEGGAVTRVLAVSTPVGSSGT